MLVASPTKQALLDAAKRLVAERGYAGTSVRDLAAASGANLAAVNYHFGSREKLLNQAVLESFLEWTDRLARAAQTDPDAGPLHRMLASTQTMFEDFPAAQPLFALFLEAVLQARRSPELHEQLAEHYVEQRRRVGEIVTAGQGEHPLPARLVEVIASVLIAVADGLLLQSLLDPSAVPTGDEFMMLGKGLAATAKSNQPSAAPTRREPR